MKLERMVFGVLLLLASMMASALELPLRTTTFVNDFAEMLSPEEERVLNAKLGEFKNTSRVSMVVATISAASDYGYSGLVEMGTSLFERWAPGEKGLNSGILVIVAGKSPPYKIRIVTGRGVEGAVPDLIAKRVIEDMMKPVMHKGGQGAYALGLTRGIEALMQRAKNEFAPKSAPATSGHSSSSTAVLLPVLLVLGIGVALFFFLFYRSSTVRRAQELREQENADAERLRALREQNHYATTRQPTQYREPARHTPKRQPPTRRMPARDDVVVVAIPTSTYQASEPDAPDTDTSSPDTGGETSGSGSGDN